MILKNTVDQGYFNNMKGVDLKKVVGIALPEGGTQGKIEILAFENIVSVREKLSATFPPIQVTGLITIQSVAILPDGNTLFSVTGNLTSQVKLLVEKITEIVKRDGMKGAYFPAYGENVHFYIGGHKGVANAEKLPDWMKNVQPFTVRKRGEGVLSQGIIFTDDTSGHEIVNELSLNDLYKKAWSSSKKIGELKAKVLYMDRVQGGFTVITTEEGVFTLNLMTGGIKTVHQITEKPSAVLRLGNNAIAFIKKEVTEIFPSASPVSQAIAEAC